MILIDTTFLSFGQTGIYTVINQFLDFFKKEKLEYQQISFFDFFKKKSFDNWFKYFNLILPREIKKLDEEDIFLCPENLAGFYFYKKQKCKTIFMVLDLFEFRTGNKIKDFVNSNRLKLVTKNVDKIVTISNFCVQDISKTFPKLKSKIYCYYPFYFNSDHIDKLDDVPQSFTQGSRDFILGNKYILANGSGQKRKNVQFIIQNANKIFRDFGLKTVLFGKDSNGDGYSEIFDCIKTNACEENIVHLGAVSNEQLKYLYQHCACFVFPSLDEGFGLPPVEALLQGSRIAVSNIPIFKEILAPSSYYFDFNYESFSNTLHFVLTEPKEKFEETKTKILNKFTYQSFKKTLMNIL